MTTYVVRVFLFSILPLLLSAGILLLDRSASTRERRLEVPLIFLFGLGVRRQRHRLLLRALLRLRYRGRFDRLAQRQPLPARDGVRQSRRRHPGRHRRRKARRVPRGDGDRGDGARRRRIHRPLHGYPCHRQSCAGQHHSERREPHQAGLPDPAACGFTTRRSAADSEADTPQFELWRAPLLQAVGIVTAIVATAFAVGFAVGQALIVSLLGALGGFRADRRHPREVSGAQGDGLGCMASTRV